MITLIILLALWELFWTYQACWLAAQRNERKWFLFFLMFNLLGIPEIIYLQKKSGRLFKPVAPRAVAHQAKALARSNNQLAHFPPMISPSRIDHSCQGRHH